MAQAEPIPSDILSETMKGDGPSFVCSQVIPYLLCGAAGYLAHLGI